MTCAFCGKPNATRRVECNAPDQSTQVFRYFCTVACEANYGTNQPKPDPRGLFG